MSAFFEAFLLLVDDSCHLRSHSKFPVLEPVLRVLFGLIGPLILDPRRKESSEQLFKSRSCGAIPTSFGNTFVFLI